MPNDTWPEWERVLSAAAHLQRIIPDAVLVGGTAAAVYARHRLSTDADHVLGDLPYDLEGLDLSEYKSLDPRWHDWAAVKAACVRYSILIFDHIVGV